MSHHRPFLALWALAVAASVAAFVLHLAMRSRSMHLGYELGRARAEQARLREVKRVLELEVASYHTPQRVETVARTLLGMSPPSPDRIISMPSPRDASGAVRPEAVTNGNTSERSARGSVAARGGVSPMGRGAAAGAGAGQGAPTVIVPPASTELLTPHITPPKSAQTAEPAAAQAGSPQPQEMPAP